MKPFDTIKISELKTLRTEDLFRRVDTTDTFKYGHIWRLLDNSEWVRKFLEVTMHMSISPFLLESQKQPKDKKRDGMDKIEICFVIDNLINEIETWWEIHGIGKKRNRTTYALDFTPVHELMDYDVCFANKTYVRQRKLLKFKGIPSPTLLDVLYIVLYEVSFHGSPETRDERMKDLEQRIKDLKSGKLKTIPWEEAKKQIKKRIKNGMQLRKEKRNL